MKYIIRKVIEASSLQKALEIEHQIRPLEIYLPEDTFKVLTFNKENEIASKKLLNSKRTRKQSTK